MFFRIPCAEFSAYPDGHKMLTFTVVGDFPAYERVRVNCKNKRAFDPASKKKKNFAKELKEAFEDASIPLLPFAPDEKKGLVLTATFGLPRNKGDFRVKGGKPTNVLKDSAQAVPLKKDVDNMVKFLMDAVNHAVYDNDNVVVELHVKKEFLTDEYGNGMTFVKFTTKDD
jgi:Holliday junction resolvase RusA-like endonuclease